MKRVMQDHRVLKGYVDFVGAQYHKAIDDEQQGHDKQVGTPLSRHAPPPSLSAVA